MIQNIKADELEAEEKLVLTCIIHLNVHMRCGLWYLIFHFRNVTNRKANLLHMNYFSFKVLRSEKVDLFKTINLLSQWYKSIYHNLILTNAIVIYIEILGRFWPLEVISIE